MTSVNVYLIFNGNCGEAFNFYKSVFGGEFAMIAKFKDMPPQPGMTLSEEDGEKIMHVSLPVSRETTLMASDAATAKDEVTVGNNFSISINADSREIGDKLFTDLSSGGQARMPMADTFWGAYFGMLTDKFGINWMVNVDTKGNK